MGAQVRDTMMKISGTKPEHLPLSDDIREVKKSLKKTKNTFQKIDQQKKTNLETKKEKNS